MLGVQHSTADAFTESEQRVVQKAFFDHMWDYPLTEMIAHIGDALPPRFDYEGLAKRLNEGNALHASSVKSFHQAYQAEIQGSLSLIVPIARKVLEERYSRALGRQVIASEAERVNSERELFNFFCAAIARKQVALALRTLHVGALCHAAVRWDKRRKLTGNDLYDFHHAEAAIAYCDVFLTERPLRTLLQQKHLQLDQDFACRVISAQSEAVEWARS